MAYNPTAGIYQNFNLTCLRATHSRAQKPGREDRPLKVSKGPNTGILSIPHEKER